MFALGAEYLPETMTVLKMTDGGKNVEFAALLILMKLENYLSAFLDAIKHHMISRERGLASRFIDTLVELMEKLSEGAKQKGAKQKGAFFIKSQP